MGLRRFLFWLTAGIILLVIAAVWLVPLDEDFRVENPLWNGALDMNQGYGAQALNSYDELPPSPGGTTLIVVPYLELTDIELEQLASFVNNGGRLILADDYAHGNSVLAYLGLATRFSGEILLDPLSNYKNANFPLINHIQSDPLTQGTESLVLNHATSLENVSDANAIALSSSFSFLDLDEDGQYDEDETSGPLPVIGHESLGQGQVIIIADPSLFINSMDELGGNQALLDNIAATTDALYLDQSHLPPSDLHQTKTLLAQGREYLATPLATAGLVALVVVVTLQPVWYRKKEKPEETSGDTIETK